MPSTCLKQVTSRTQILSTVRSLGLTCEGDMRALLLMPAELLESEEKELQKVLRESLLALVPYEVRLSAMLRAVP